MWTERLVFLQATIQSIEFHPSAKVLLTAGFNKTLDLFQVILHVASDGACGQVLVYIFIYCLLLLGKIKKTAFIIPYYNKCIIGILTFSKIELFVGNIPRECMK